MADGTDVLLKFCEEEWVQARQSESQRATVTNFVITISAVILTLLVHREFALNSLPLSIFLTILGLYGVLISTKLYERWHFHRRRARYWTRRIDELHPDARLLQLKSESIAKHESKYPKLTKIRLNHLWLTLHTLICLIGIVCTIVIICRGI